MTSLDNLFKKHRKIIKRIHNLYAYFCQHSKEIITFAEFWQFCVQN